ncbi:cell division protein FtsW [Iodidimonas muriae]|uniref:Probable peptidoglycan glycosyltransferase FtsW n=1 Tax=Iodidimonas muriae TaxID=261467 RepID=A0ABQ2LE71_9PROT|nr:putative lipid II flippase FtsW [Iodidimonas muriae]GER06800.1 cell division protein FtsW [Kordiimonadales bacterium JCM 17843]GGO09931.1 cell division protein FtsW [Iodidimonas muriae]
MSLLSRADESLVARWWWTVDRWLLVAVIFLLGAGLVLTFGASTPVAERLGLPVFHFAKRQLVFLALGLVLMITVSLASVKMVRRGAIALFALCLVLMVVTLLFGPDYNGATRWVNVAGFTLQPAEFLKPAFAVVSAWLFAGAMDDKSFPGRQIASGLFVLCAGLLILQPDIGQTILLGSVWSIQMILAGLPLLWIGGLLVLGIVTVFLCYLFVPHVTERFDRFLDPSSGDTYQVDTALNAFRAGGLFGRGPGEGAVKKVLPDAHTDYIFAVAGEEFGALVCLIIVGVFAVIVMRGLVRLTEEEDPFIVLAAGGLLSLFGLQAMINIGVNLALLPSKGMTLPFISYGGSSMLALGLSMGMVLALTRKNRFETGPRLHTSTVRGHWA